MSAAIGVLYTLRSTRLTIGMVKIQSMTTWDDRLVLSQDGR